MTIFYALFICVSPYLLCSAYNYSDGRQNITIGFLLDNGSGQQEIPLVNVIYASNIMHSSINFSVSYRAITSEDVFDSNKILCNLTNSGNGLAAIFGPSSINIGNLIESTCSNLEIPYIQTSWNPSTRFSKFTSINFYPDSELLAKGIATIVERLEWKTFVILYEDEKSLDRLQYVLKLDTYTDGRIGNKIKLKKLGPGPDYRAVLKDIKYIPETNILLDCRTEKLYGILKQARLVRMLEVFHSYFITSLDAHTIDLDSLDTNANITTIRIFEPESPEMKQTIRHWELAEHNLFHKEVHISPYEIQTSTVLMQDAIQHLVDSILTLHHTQKIGTRQLSCSDDEIWEGGFRITSFMKVKPVTLALSAPIKFDEGGARTNFNIYLIQGTRNTTLAVWNSQNTVSLTSNRTKEEQEQDIREMLQKQTFTVITRFSTPFLSLKKLKDGEHLEGNEMYEGYSMDFMKAISAKIGFKFEMKIVEDGELGSYDENLRTWDGLINEIIEHRAHLAISDLAMTYQRQQVVDFSIPFMNLGISLLYKKSSKKRIPVFEFLSPFSGSVWAYTATLFLALSIVFFLTYRMAPDEWENPHPCDPNPEELENVWDLKNCLWLTLGSLLQQGCDILPRATSSRLTLSMWWFFSLIMYNSYTAQLAAVLTTEQTGISIKNVEELAKQNKIKYGIMDTGSTMEFFRDSNYSIYQKMWNVMISTSPSVFVKSDEEGIRRVITTKDSLYAYMTESTKIDYVVINKCELRTIGSWLNSISYAIAMPINAQYLGIINSAILELSENGELAIIGDKWWIEMRDKPMCEDPWTEEDSSVMSLSLEKVAGVFLVTGVGIGIAHIIAFCEFFWNVKNVAVDEHISYMEALKHELKFVINIKMSKKRTKLKHKSASSSHSDNAMKSKSRTRSILQTAGSLFNLNKIDKIKT